jgi:NAD(P)-dependent dehydrogenase (short-subunit alcohol dehydrogenase family)
MENLKNKVAVVTGANSGIGLAIAELFSMAGAKVVLAARREDKLKEAQEKLTNETAICLCDVSDITQLDNLFQFTKNTYGNIDILVANAGVSSRKHIKDVTEDDFDHLVATNFKGVFFTVQRALPVINNNASIILVSSVAAHKGDYARSLYSSTKSAVSQLACNFASDLVEENIRVNAISPGCIDTPIWDSAKSRPSSIEENYTRYIPQGRFGTSDEVARLALFLASDASSYITGQDIKIDGGFTNINVIKP